MAHLISYAQNFEDLMLWRALGDVNDGHYIDIGAQSPTTDSVSRLFYEHGWCGVHVEPVPDYAEQLRVARKGETVVQAAVAANAGTIAFFEIHGTGLSTADPDIAEQHRRNGFEVAEILVPAVTLDDILANFPFEHVHWLKIDVEAGEEAVLRGWNASEVRPWIVVVESTRPLTPEEDYEQWEPLLLSKGYEFVYFDGLNRFYVWVGKSELTASFHAGPNIFDGFSLSPHSAFCAEVNVQYGKLEEILETERAAALDAREQLGATLESARQQIADLQKTIVRSEEAARDELASVTRQCMQAQAVAMRAQEESSALREAVTEAEQQTARAYVAAETQRTALLASLALAEQEVRDLTAETTAELDAAYVRIDEVRHVAHRWWLTAEQQRVELEAMKSSHSWVLTRPLRSMRFVVGRVLAAAKIRTKIAMRPLIAACAATALKFPVLKRMALPLLARSPRVLDRIRKIAISGGLIAAPVVFEPIASYTRPSTPRQVKGRAAKVLQDLRRAMDAKGVDR